MAVDNLAPGCAVIDTVSCMRWDNLFDDLESQLENELSAEDLDLQAEEERLRLGRMSLRDRLAAAFHFGEQEAPELIRVILSDGESVGLHPVALGKDWLSGVLADEASSRHQCIIPLTGVGGLIFQPAQVVASLSATKGQAPTSHLSARLSLAFVLRDLCRRRHSVDVELTHSAVHGTVDRVGRDHLDLAVHDRGMPRRESAVRQYRIIPFDQIKLIRV